MEKQWRPRKGKGTTKTREVFEFLKQIALERRTISYSEIAEALSLAAMGTSTTLISLIRAVLITACPS